MAKPKKKNKRVTKRDKQSLKGDDAALRQALYPDELDLGETTFDNAATNERADALARVTWGSAVKSFVSAVLSETDDN